ncbi:MAG: phosphate signaling complex protein PhoU [Rhizobiaceae bacterium]
MSQHTVSAFDEDLKYIRLKITEMGGRAEEMLAQSVAALTRGDTVLAESVIERDLTLDRLQFELDERIVLVIARRQPMAADLREIVAALRMGNDLERAGDMGKNIAKRVKEMTEFVYPRRLAHGLETLASLGLEQLKGAIDAYVNRDIARAAEVLERDDEIDTVYTSLFRELLTYMMEDPRNITYCTHLLFCAKNIERIGDHATNIVEEVRYMVTGESELSQHGTRIE